MSGRFITTLTFREAVTATLTPNDSSAVISHTGLRVSGPSHRLKCNLTRVFCLNWHPHGNSIAVGLGQLPFPSRVLTLAALVPLRQPKGGIISLGDSGFLFK